MNMQNLRIFYQASDEPFARPGVWAAIQKSQARFRFLPSKISCSDKTREIMATHSQVYWVWGINAERLSVSWV